MVFVYSSQVAFTVTMSKNVCAYSTHKKQRSAQSIFKATKMEIEKPEKKMRVWEINIHKMSIGF